MTLRLKHTLRVWHGMPLLRALWWRHVRRYEFEICHECGRPVWVVWWCFDNKLWERVTGYVTPPNDNAPGILCIPCFDKIAKDHSLWIEWAPANVRHLTKGA